MNAAGNFFVRWRVRLGYPLVLAVLYFARPMPGSVLIGGVVGFLGLLVRAYAAGYLHKQEILTVTGPYARTRNPLYLGSAILALGAGIATRSWLSGCILILYFTIFYAMVMRKEEQELLAHHGAAYEEYARSVPLFFPRMTPAKLAGETPGSFSFAQYRKNHEWRATVGFLLVLAVLLLIWRLGFQL